jgi:hypothetical protein
LKTPPLVWPYDATFSMVVWCQAKLFIMLHVSFELSFVCIFQLIPGDCLDVVWVNFESTTLRVLRHCWLLRVPLGVTKVCWCENRMSPLCASHVTPRSVARRASQSNLLVDNVKY